MDDKAILIVDDVELNRAILSELFHSSYRIFEAANGRQALEVLREHRDEIAVVLLDIVMPVMDGYEVLENMNREKWLVRLPVVLITAENSDTASLRSYDLGVADIINKPFNPGIVKRRVDNIIELYQHKAHLETLVDKQVKALEQQALKLNQANAFMIEALSSVVEFRSSESGRHIKRIRFTTRLLLEALAVRHPKYGLTPLTMDRISLAASMHDIGKIAIPDSVLNKPGKLTAEEFEIMKTHTLKGCELLQSLNYSPNETFYRYCYDICRSHHERWDGRGYPDGLAGARIPIWAQVVSLADVYDALTSERTYKRSYSHQEAVDMILGGECGAFNPELLEVFVAEAPRLQKDPHGLSEAQAFAEATTPFDPFAEEAAERAAARDAEVLSARTLWLLEREREKYRIVAELSGDIVFSYDMGADVLEFSEKYHTLFGRDTRVPHTRERLTATDLIHDEDRSLIDARLGGLTPQYPRCRLELRLRTRSGRYEWFEVYTHALWDVDAGYECVGYIGKLANIHERKAEASILRERAHTDALTRVANRPHAEERITAALRNDSGTRAALLFLDLDDFKSINDRFGHPVGDRVLCCLAGEIRARVRESDVVGRLGGDEFVVFLRNVSSEKDVARKAEELCNLNCATLCADLADEAPVTSCSVGIAMSPEDGVDYAELMARADNALYQAKARGKRRYAFYSSAGGDAKELHPAAAAG